MYLKSRENIKFIVPFNGDLEYIYNLPDEVSEVYGKISADGFLGGRAHYSLKNITQEMLETLANICKSKGIKLKYLLNAPLQGQDQFEKSFIDKVKRLIDFLSKIGVDGIVISLPHLSYLIKSQFPHLTVSVSKFARVNSIQSVKLWEDMGADQICLDGNLTKRPNLIKAITSNSRVPIIMLCNDACIEDCPFENYHATYEGIHSTNKSSNYISYFSTLCKFMMAKDKILILRSTFIRPEDIDFYSNLGINQFKIVDRNRDSIWINQVLDAYINRKYEGNLANILSLFSPIKTSNKKKKVKSKFDINSFQALKKEGVFDLRVFINNELLGGYIQYIMDNKCDLRTNCLNCSFCDNIASSAITFSSIHDKVINNLTQAIHAVS